MSVLSSNVKHTKVNTYRSSVLLFSLLPLLSLPRWTWLAFSHFTTSQCNQRQCLAINVRKWFSVLPKISYGKIMGRSNIHLKSGQHRENGECINYKNDPFSVMITPFSYSLSVNRRCILCHWLFFSQSPSTPATFCQQLWIKRHLKMAKLLKISFLLRSLLSVGICKFAASAFLTKFSTLFI